MRIQLASIFLIISTISVVAESNAPLELASVGAVAIDIDKDQVLVSENAGLVMPIASLTKLMTAVVVIDSEANLDEWLEIRDWESKLQKNAYSRIRTPSQARRRDLLRIALMSSENRAAYNLALHHPGGSDRFVKDMNEKALSLGMQDTTFAEPTGISLENRSSAGDLARLVVSAIDYPLIREHSTTRQFSVNFRKPRYQLGYGNTNPLTGSSRWKVALTKTGYLTEAGRCLIMVADIGGSDVGVILLNSKGSRSPLGDAGRIRRWLESGTVGSVAPAARDHKQSVLDSLRQ